jgi:hypothetical protein
MKTLAALLGVLLVGVLAFALTVLKQTRELPATPIVRVVTVTCHSSTPRALPYDCRNVNGEWLPLTSDPPPAPMLKPGRPTAPVDA